MIVLGLTGSIGTGKSTTAEMFRSFGVPVHDADATVHALYRNEAVGPVGQAFPGVVENGVVDRKALAARLADRPEGFEQLEAIIHPLVRKKEAAFLDAQRAAGTALVVLDIPLLFETGGEKRVDKTVVVTCAPETQRLRVLARPGMTEEKFAMLLSRQLADAEKRARADFVVSTDNGLEPARQQVEQIVESLRKEMPPMREIIFDTETTGLDNRLDRVIEIGGIELDNHFPTGRTFHVYINPGDRKVHPDALAIHGISDDFLKDKPRFADIVEELQAFFGDARWVAHNATFDMGFINAEYERLGLSPIPAERVTDTLALARRKNPMGPNSLDALCRRYGIDNSHRTKHGALLDSELLAEVYIEMIGGRQTALGLGVVEQRGTPDATDGEAIALPAAQRPRALAPRIGTDEIAAHAAMVEKMGAKAIWLKYQKQD